MIMKFGRSCAMVTMLLAGVISQAAEKPSDKPATQPAAVNKKCPISGDDVSATAKTVTYKGKVVGFCCDDCVDLFNKDPDKYADKIK